MLASHTVWNLRRGVDSRRSYISEEEACCITGEAPIWARRSTVHMPIPRGRVPEGRCGKTEGQGPKGVETTQWSWRSIDRMGCRDVGSQKGSGEERPRRTQHFIRKAEPEACEGKWRLEVMCCQGLVRGPWQQSSGRIGSCPGFCWEQDQTGLHCSILTGEKWKSGWVSQPLSQYVTVGVERCFWGLKVEP